MEEARPHAVEMAQEADAPPHEGPEDAQAVVSLANPFHDLRF
jgi:hypothetical protein